MDSTNSVLAPLGRAIKAEFPFNPDWHNLNHGAFGAIPSQILRRQQQYQRETEAQVDQFIRYQQPVLLDRSRAAVAKLLHAPVETVVFVNHTTEGINTILRNLTWAPDGNDVVFTFSTVYDSCAAAVDFLVDRGLPLQRRSIQLDYPLDDNEVIQAFRNAVTTAQSQGKRPRACIFDTVSSLPAVCFPWASIVKECLAFNILSVVDGAHGVGMLHLDLPGVDPDFFISNCHKWLHVPRGCAVLYVPVRNQHLLPSSLATESSYKAKNPPSGEFPMSLLPSKGSPKSQFERIFQTVGTRDHSPSLCVADAIGWRENVLGGEDRIVAHLQDLNKRGLRLVAERLGTYVLDNAAGTLTNCAMGNVALPLSFSDADSAPDASSDFGENHVFVPSEDEPLIARWIAAVMVEEYKTFITCFKLQSRVWARISAQVYLDLQDYEYAAVMFRDICSRIRGGQ